MYEANNQKVQPVKVVAPFLNSQSESPVPLDALTDQEKVSDLYFLKGTVHQIAKPYLSINNCTFKQQIFSECQFKSAQLTDVRFENCDLSNVSFAGTTFYRVEFISCKLLGTGFPEATLNHVLMDHCYGQYINLSMVKMRTVRFSHCNFRNGSLNDSKLMPAAFDTCELLEADFSHTSLKGIDLRNSRIAGIQLNIADLKGAIVSSLQAIDLLPLLGVKIEDD
ncbi:pentapeptide repeat-containing protein [Bacteroides fragilis]